MITTRGGSGTCILASRVHDILWAIWRLGEYFAHVKHDHTFLKSSSDNSAVIRPIDVKDGLAVWIDITCTICLGRRIVEAADLFVVFERPYVDIRVLTTYCQK